MAAFGGDFHIGRCIRGLLLEERWMTIAMDPAYGYYQGSIDPHEAYPEFQDSVNEFSQKVKTIVHPSILDEYLVDTLALMVFASNLVGRVGLGIDMTLRFCRPIFRGEKHPSNLSDYKDEYEALRYEMEQRGLPVTPGSILRTRREIIHHALAAKYMLRRVCIDGDSLSEDIIRETHWILTHKINAPDGTSWREYGGVYRKCPAAAGLHSFTDHDLIPAAMRRMISCLDEDLRKASERGQMDPIALAAKYCHMFANIQPFLYGNGQICCLILNMLLIKYGGIMICMGATEADRAEYLGILANASTMGEASTLGGDDEDDLPEECRRKHYKELATFMLKHARQSVQAVVGLLKIESYLV